VALTEQIPLQQKIAELEQRIERLEKQRIKRIEFTHTTTSSEPLDSDHWKEMWRHFNEAVKEILK
jgi:hypothetical protein